MFPLLPVLALLALTAVSSAQGPAVPDSGEDAVVAEQTLTAPAETPDEGVLTPADLPEDTPQPATENLQRFATGLGLFGVAVIILAGIATVRKHRLRPRLFPLTEYRHRFSAPHSGGNNASVSWPEPADRREPPP